MLSERPDPSRHAVEYAEVRRGVRLAYVREGIGGYPILLVHGYPETKRIWWRNIAALAGFGFEVIAPDLRGHGDSGLAPDGFYDIAAFSLDLYALVHDCLGHERCAAVGGDVGGPVVYDLGLRFGGFVERQCIFNTVAPMLDHLYEQAGAAPNPIAKVRQTADYFVRQGRDADGLLAQLDTPERRRAWVAAMYGHRLWAGAGAFTTDEIDFMTDPYADVTKLRASWGIYEVAAGLRATEATPRLFEPTEIPTLVLYGPEDHVVPESFPRRFAVACKECIGPFVVPGVGHFVQWEAAHVLNRTLRYLCADLLARR